MEWTDTDGVIPEEWGWSGKVVLSWGQTDISVAPLATGKVKFRVENRGSETARIPHAPRGVGMSVTYEGRVRAPSDGEDVTHCFPSQEKEPLVPGESWDREMCVTGEFRSRLPGRYLLTWSGPREGVAEGPPRRWRLLPALTIRVLRATTEEIETILAGLKKRKPGAWLSPEEAALWGDLGDARLLAPLEALAKEMEGVLAGDPKGSRNAVGALKDIRFAMAKIRVLLALDAGRDDEVGVFLDAPQPDDRGHGHFKAMLRARMEALKKER